MTTSVLGRLPGDWIKNEFDPAYCRAVKTALSGQTIKAGQVCVSDANGKKCVVTATGNETHTYTPNTSATGGVYTLTLWHKDGYWVTTGDIAYNANNSAIGTAVEAVLGSSSVTVAAGIFSTGTAITIQYSGTNYANLSFPLGSCDISRLKGVTSVPVTRSISAGAAKNEVQTLIWGTAATGGTFKLGIKIPAGQTGAGGWVWTDAMAWNATDSTFLAAINAGLDDVLGASKIVATARQSVDTDLGIVLTFSGTGYAGIAHEIVQQDTGALTSVTTATTTRTTAGGLGGGQLANYADCIAINDIDASGGDTTGVFLVRGPAVVDKDRLYYGGGDVDTCCTALAAVGIVTASEATLRSVQTL